MMMKMTKLGMAFLAAAIAFNVQAGNIDWRWQVVPNDLTPDPNAIVYFILDGAKQDVINALAAGNFDASDFASSIAHTYYNETHGLLKAKDPANSIYIYNLHMDIPGTDGTGTTPHDMFLLFLNPNNNDGYDAYYALRKDNDPVYVRGDKGGGGWGATSAWGFGDGVGGWTNAGPVTLIPEPTTGLLALVGAATLLLRRRRRE